MSGGNPTGYKSCRMCWYSCTSTDATQTITFGGKRIPVCDYHAANPIADPRAQVIDFKTDRNHYGGKTSAEAAEAAHKSAKLGDTHYRILGRLVERPRTPDEIAVNMRLNWSTARARMTDLKNAGLIVATGETRTADGGKEANVMRPTTPSEREQERAA